MNLDMIHIERLQSIAMPSVQLQPRKVVTNGHDIQHNYFVSDYIELRLKK